MLLRLLDADESGEISLEEFVSGRVVLRFRASGFGFIRSVLIPWFQHTLVAPRGQIRNLSLGAMYLACFKLYEEELKLEAI